MANVLVVGGTGMLDDVSRFLASSNNTVCVVARTERALQELVESVKEYAGTIIPVKVDFQNLQSLKDELVEVIDKYGPFTLALSWIQSGTEAIHRVIAEIINKISPVCRYFNIRSGNNGEQKSDPNSELFAGLDRILYREISVGVDSAGNGGKSLTNSEICNGIVDAIREDRSESYVGMAV